MKKRLTRILALALVMLSILSLAACGGNGGGNAGNGGGAASGSAGDSGSAAPAGYKDTLVWAQGADVTSLDPHQGKETPAVEVTCQIFDTLLVVDPETNELVPQIAESWEQTDELTYVFKIREGIKFHDGSDLTPADVKFSLERAINSAAVSYIVDFIDTITDNGDGTVTIKTKLDGKVNVYYWNDETKKATLIASPTAADGRVTFATKQLGHLILTTGTI